MMQAAIIEEYGVSRLREGDFSQEAAIFGDCRDPARDIVPANQHHQNSGDTVPMQALGSRVPGFHRIGRDAELMHLSVPCGFGPARQRACKRFSDLEQCYCYGMNGNRSLDRREPARETTVQAIVLAALIVRLMAFETD